MLKVRQVNYVPWEGDPAELVNLAEASRITGLALNALIGKIERGVLTEVIDDEAGYHGRRKLIKAELSSILGVKENLQIQ